MDAVQTNAIPSQSAQLAKGDTGGTGEVSDYETFLKMLTVQMQNQDPLNPVESSDFAAQLATFSTVEQQVLTNDLLTSIEARLANSDFATLAGWVGMDARSPNDAYFTGEAITVATQRDPSADRNDFVVRDKDGQEVYRVSLPADMAEITWAGEMQNGMVAPEGVYSLAVEGFASGEATPSIPLQSYGRVEEARVEDGTLKLVLAGGQVISADDVTALRAPV